MNRNGGVAMDVCSDIDVENHVNMSGGVLADVYSDVSIINDVNKSRGASVDVYSDCLLYTSPSPRDEESSRMPSSA